MGVITSPIPQFLNFSVRLRVLMGGFILTNDRVPSVLVVRSPSPPLIPWKMILARLKTPLEAMIYVTTPDIFGFDGIAL